MLRLMLRSAVMVIVLVMTDGLSAAPQAPLPLDLSAGALSQSNCKTAIGCGHAHVSVTAAALVSTGTNRSPTQHILTLDIPVPALRAAKGSHVIELDYDLSNPSGHANNVICAVIQERQGEVARCARGVAAKGRLQVPVADAPAVISVRFGLMPFSEGHVFAVRNVTMSKGGADKEKVTPAARRVPVRLGGGRLRQPGCATPIGCDHPDVTLTDTLFSSSVTPANGPPPPPSDNPNEPPPPQQQLNRIELELPVDDVSKGRRSLRFSYLLAGANQQRPGRIVVSAMTDESIWQSAIAVSGEGEAGFEIPGGNGETETMTVAFEPSAGTGAVSFRISDVSYGVGGPPAGDALPIEETSSTPSRLDPCGPELITFWVEAANGRSGRGIRCMSVDLTAWYGEGWWNDFDYGWYRHIGYVHQRASGLPSMAHAADLGVIAEGAEMRYGGNGLADVRMAWRSLDRLHVSTPSGHWNETWRLIPKGELLPAPFVPREWDYQCGGFGLASFNATLDHPRQRRCAIPMDLFMYPNVEYAATPLVWLGEGRIEEGVPSSTATGVHLGWQLAPPDSGAAGFYAASDVCPSEHAAGCRTIDTIRMEVVGPEPPAVNTSPQYFWWISDHHNRQGLYVVGPGTWERVLSDGEHFGHAWVPTSGELGSLPEPTPICFTADCP